MFRDGYSPNVRLGGMSPPLASLVNCQHDLTEEGKVVHDAFQAEIPQLTGVAAGPKVMFPASQGWGTVKVSLGHVAIFVTCHLWEVGN